MTSLAVLAATVGVWINRTIWDTDRYVALVAPLAEDPAVTDAVSAKLTASAVQALDIEDRVRNALSLIPNLPPSAEFLVAPITAGAQDLIQRRIDTFLASQTFKDMWVELNRTLHTKIVALLDGDVEQLPNISTTGGQVQLNLISVLARILQQVVQRGVDGLDLNVTVPTISANLDASTGIQQLGSVLGVSLPSDFGQVTIMTEAQLSSYQQAARDLKRLGGALVVLAVILIAVTMVVALRRRRTAIWLGIGSVVALFLGGVFMRRIEARIVDSIAGPGAQAAARDIFTEVGASLRQAGLVVGAVALAVALGAYLAGRPRWLVSLLGAIRRATATRAETTSSQRWVVQHADAIGIASLILGALTLFVTGIDWLPVVLVAAGLVLIQWWIGVARRAIATPEDRPLREGDQEATAQTPNG
jgi:hypothetical protein